MEFGLLGALRVGDDAGAACPVPPGRMRSLLAVLLVHADSAVSLETLAACVWEEQQRPRQPRQALQVMVVRLRKQLGPEAGARITSARPGYRLAVRPGELDLHRFEELAQEGSAALAAQDWAGARELLGRALAEWRGEPLADVQPGTALDREQEALAGLRLRAQRQLVAARLKLGEHAELVSEIADLVEDHPFDEQLQGQLMLALHGCGRRAEALEVFQNARRALVDELGIEPGAELTELHRAVLSGDASPPQRPAAPQPDGPAAVRPAQLSADLADFTGRAELVGRLEGLLVGAGGRQGGTAVVLTALDGAGGIGKTALAVHVAHRVLAQFPDGQLQADLHGAGASPADPHEVLARFLRGLGITEENIPSDPEERAALYRSTLAGRRALILLDNVKDSAQVRPLLPGVAGCAVIITSRSALPALDGAQRLTVSVLGEAEALELFTRIVGEDSVAAHPEAVATVLRICAGLPLAIRIAASRLACQPGWTVETLAEQLQDESSLLDELAVEDRAVRSSFAVSFNSLPAPQASAFGLLGLWEGPDVTAPAAAALLDVDTRSAQHTLDALARIHLLEAPRPRRYAFHDLIRVFARERLLADVPAGAREDALNRYLGWYLHSADAAARVMTPQRRHAVPEQVEPGRGRLEFASYEAAQSWLDAEHRNLMAVLATAAATERHGVAMRLPTALWELFNHRGYWEDWITACTLGLAAARQAGSEDHQASLLIDLGSAQLRAGRLAEAIDSFGAAIVMRRAQGDVRGEATARYNLAIVFYELQRLEEASRAMEAALELHRSIGNRFGEGATLSGLGQIALALGDTERGLELQGAAMAVYEELGDRFNTAIGYEQLSLLLYGAGRLDEAVTASRKGIEANREVGHVSLEGKCWEYLGTALAARGDGAQAAEAFDRARELLAELDPAAEARIDGLCADFGLPVGGQGAPGGASA
ncbi:BTAD domain-containing putative transcriptional regulator [Kitasatospora sp. NPDC002227]|uniref:AfsR/SARP family transcriptional regulator n=1 Tax=Kitasatospora sp. NPDC002227 TaxID=3154773 RepID=UPI00332FD60E